LFSERASYIYNAYTDCHAFSIRKGNFQALCEENPEIARILRQSILMDYFANVLGKMEAKKRQAIAKLQGRKDHQHIFTNEPKDKSAFAALLLSSIAGSTRHDMNELDEDGVPVLDNLTKECERKVSNYE
jgi:CRP-like cAMP-binding protein